MGDAPRSRQAASLITVGLALTVVALATRESLDDRAVFGIPGEFVTVLMFILAVAILILAVVRSRRAG